ncbi:MAG: DUF3737 family protein [Succinivibrio sp.]|nr:DUF3737 family protein [Succinivibrio sp.]
MKIEKTLTGQRFAGERPLFGSKHLRLVETTIGEGESGLKNCQDLELERCCLEGKYPLWHVHNFTVQDCVFKPTARAALWYSTKLRMLDTKVEAPKMFREMEDLSLERVCFCDALETLWDCRKVTLKDVSVEHGDYIFLYNEDLHIEGLKLQGNYAFQHVKRAKICNSQILTKDSFWESEDVTCENCVIESEYLGWHSRNLTLRNCRIIGTQPLCYAHNLTLEHCVFDENCDLCFEDSTLTASIDSAVKSIKNPRSGRIEVEKVGEIIEDEFCLPPHDCVIVERSKV